MIWLFRYKANVQRVSSLLKDQSVAPLDKVVFWLEYVIRHKGAPHLKSAAEHLNFFQYFLVDVLGFVALVFAIILGLIYFVVRMCLRLVCQKIPKLQKVKKN